MALYSFQQAGIEPLLVDLLCHRQTKLGGGISTKIALEEMDSAAAPTLHVDLDINSICWLWWLRRRHGHLLPALHHRMNSQHRCLSWTWEDTDYPSIRFFPQTTDSCPTVWQSWVMAVIPLRCAWRRTDWLQRVWHNKRVDYSSQIPRA